MEELRKPPQREEWVVLSMSLTMWGHLVPTSTHPKGLRGEDDMSENEQMKEKIVEAFPEPVDIPQELLKGSEFLDALDWPRRFQEKYGAAVDPGLMFTPLK